METKTLEQATITEIKAELFDTEQKIRGLQQYGTALAQELEKRLKKEQLPIEPVTDEQQTEQEKPEEVRDTEGAHKA